ncbi:coenzyme F420-0:L-glutamate ligase [Microlunatus soli]|uniref:Coenzyme F420-0:L-glutamate ligase n=1 Tax=Microlunatus soli TaxID=630515 RepID=A0A1H1ZH86_9ACTN|nr:coenzyme F420-0:L-glutamate ligase [Microlunatus soli]SDT33054.1 coenzyme F420-0:L-glutamate ligase [Microlunatus soli]
MSGDASYTVTALNGIGDIQPGDDVGQVIADALAATGRELANGDVICVASKIISVAEGRRTALDTITPTECALRLQAQIPRRDARVVQTIIDQTADPTGRRVAVSGDHISGWLPNGLVLTSAGVDSAGPDAVLLLPTDPDASAAGIAAHLRVATGRQVSVIITDSDGRPDKRGATQVAVGVHGITPLRTSHGDETLCDMLAAAAAVMMGQRSAGRPVAIVRGVEYAYDPTARIGDALHDANKIDGRSQR